jgi:hypothetical protein
VKEHPILFKGRLVRAILAGTKTQTRRVITQAVGPVERITRDVIGVQPNNIWWRFDVNGDGTIIRCPFGVPGDHLWVRESFCPNYFDDRQPGTGNKHGYRADWNSDAMHGVAPEPRWTPSIHMPRAASRITLEVTDIRVELLQAIAEEDAKAEGVFFDGTYWRGADHPIKGHPKSFPFAWQAFQSLWDSINAKRAPWASNPWVWVVSFRRVQP